MKIAYYLPSLVSAGGLEHIITFKANYFASMGHDVTILTSEQGNNPIHYALSKDVKHIDLGVCFDYPYDQSKLGKIIKYPFRYYRFKQAFRQTLTTLKADVVISTLRREVNFLSSINDGSIKIGEFHITRHSYGFGNGTQNSSIRSILQTRWEKKFLQNLSKLSAVVLLTHEEMAFWPELTNKIVIPNPIVTPADAKSTCLPHQVMAAGRYSTQKGFDLLIKSWAIVAKQHPHWILRIYGDGGLRDELQQSINTLQIENTCILEHTVPNITQKYAESSIFVLSSRYEGFGMVITEAMSCGLPVVSFACQCGPRDIITPSIDGLLVENGNIDELAKNICYLIENEAKRVEMGKQAFIKSQNYLMENIAKRWNELFTSLINTKNEVV